MEGAAKPRLRIALVAGLGLALLAACGGVAADPASPSPDEAAHTAAVTATLEAAIASATTAPGSGGAATQPGGTRNPVPQATPAPAPTPTPTPMPTITPPPRSATADGPVPATVRASLSKVKNDIPTPFFDGCHTWLGEKITSKSCLYGHTSSHTTIAIYGDSHALAWFPAVLKAVNDRGWRLLNVTMAGCTPADITPADGYGKVLPACIAFRKAALAKLAKYHPTVILVTGTRGFATVDRPGHLLTGPTRTAVWIAGMKRTIAKLIPLARRVALISDTPISKFSNPPSCLSAHLSHTIACATPVSYAIGYGWINNELSVALAKHVAFLDAERWVCPTSPCPLVRGTLVVHRDHGHMTAKFASSLWKKMEGALDQIIATPGVVIGP